MTLDELCARVGLSVRNVRFYTSRGLVPPPIRRGRSGFYSDEHIARLELVQELQAHGFTLSAIERYVSALPDDAEPEDIALARTMLAPWQSDLPVDMTRDELEQRAGRSLSEEDVATLVALGIVRVRADRFLVARTQLGIGVQLLELGSRVTWPRRRARSTRTTAARWPRSCTASSRSSSRRATAPTSPSASRRSWSASSRCRSAAW